MLAFLGLLALAIWWYTRVPTGFLPTEDQGYMFVAVQLPDAASQERTQAVMRNVDKILADTPGVGDWITIGGLSLLDFSSAPNVGTLFVTLDPWQERLEQGLTLEAVLGDMRRRFSSIKECIILPFPPPSIRGLGVRGGFQLQIEDQADVGLVELQQATQAIIEDAKAQSAIAAINSTFRPGVPQLFVDVDRVKAKTLEVPMGAIFSTLQAYLGSTYVNDFNRFGRTYQVRVQSEAAFRAEPQDIERLEVRNIHGKMIPLGTLVTVQRSFGPQVINRYNLYPSSSITGESAPGYSSGRVLEIMETIAKTRLPRSMGYDWTGMAFQEKKIGGEAILIFVMAVLLVYLVLAAQYESWFSPASVILVVPLGLLGAIAAVSLRGLDNNVYTQIGIVLIIALASKNAILIVEFARDIRNQGATILDAAVRAARLRFRPIIMTSFAFILGVVPLTIAEGAGAAGQRALGTAVFGGMIASTLLAVFFVPIFFVVFQRLGERFSRRERQRAAEGEQAAAARLSQP